MIERGPVPLSALAPRQPVAALPEANIEQVMQQGLASCFTAAQVLVCQDRKVLWHQAYGAADLDSLFDLASVTKLFTVTAFLSLASEGRVMLTLPVVDIIPEFGMLGVDGDGMRPVGETFDPLTWGPLPPNEAYKGMRVSPREVTFRHLLTHTSGLAPWLKLFEEMGDIPPPQGIADLGERARRYRRAVEIVSTCPFAGPPDTGIRYSDQGMILLGEAVARLHGTSLDMAVVQRVLRSLKLESTVYNPLVAGFSPKQVVPTEFDARWRGRRAHGEVHDENAASLGGVAGHAGLFSTAREVGIFGDAWLHCVTSGDQGALLVSPDIAQEAVRIQEAENNLRYGLGWVLKPTGDYASAGRHMSLDTFGHTGFTGTSLFIDPERNLMVAALTNRVYHGRDPEPIAAFRPVLHDAIVEALPNGE